MSASGQATPTPPSSATQRYWQLPPRSWQTTAVSAGLALLALLAVLRAWEIWPFGGYIEVTDNAYVRGYPTVIAPQVNGYIVGVLVRDFAHVRAGQVLVLIDDSIYRARVAQAKATLEAEIAALANSDQAHAARVAAHTGQIAGIASSHAQLLRGRADMARVADLVQDGSVSVRERDETRAALALDQAQLLQAQANTEIARQDIKTVDVGREGLKAQVDAARAQLRLAEIDLGYTVIRAPRNGQLSEISVRLGQYVTGGTQLFLLVPRERWVIADYKEAQTSHMAVGQRASFTVDALNGQRFWGRVQSLAPATGSEFAVLRPDNATGNFVKVPQRIGVRIIVDRGERDFDRLRPGMSVETRVDTRGGP